MSGINIPGIYESLGGCIPKGKSLVYYIQPGVEGEIYGMQMIYNSLKTGGTYAFVASSTSPGVIRNKFKDLGMDTGSFKENFFFVDAYSPLVRAPSKEKYVTSAPENIYELNRTIMDSLNELPPSTILFGSLSTIMDLCGEEETIEAVGTWNRMAAMYGHVVLYNFTAWPYSRETLNAIQKDLFNAVISIGAMAERVIFGQYFGVIKSDWK